jgi:hypothetical protein
MAPDSVKVHPAERLFVFYLPTITPLGIARQRPAAAAADTGTGRAGIQVHCFAMQSFCGLYSKRVELALYRTPATVTSGRFVMQYSKMVHRSLRRRSLLLLALMLPAWAGPACAGLGGDAAGVLDDASALRAAASAVGLQQYDVREIAAESGMRMREYLNRDGIVFAVGWSGPVMPDMQRLLGPYFEEYTAALAALKSPGLQRSVRIVSSRLVVESEGHLRAYAGRAYLPTLVPAGVPMSDLR